MDTQSPRFSLSSQDKQTIATIVIHGLVGTLLTLISMVFVHINYGPSTPLVTTVLSIVSLYLTSVLNGPSASSVRIAQLEETIAKMQPVETTAQEEQAPISSSEAVSQG